MKRFVRKIVLIIMIHLLWVVFILTAALNNDSFNHVISGITFFLIEPLCLFIIYPLIVYSIIHCIVKKEPYCVKNEKIILLVFSIICTIIAMGWVVVSYIEGYIQDGFSLFLYDDYWLR